MSEMPNKSGLLFVCSRQMNAALHEQTQCQGLNALGVVLEKAAYEEEDRQNDSQHPVEARLSSPDDRPEEEPG